MQAWLVGGPFDGDTLDNVRDDTEELLLGGRSEYVRRTGEDVIEPPYNGRWDEDPAKLVAAWFDHVEVVVVPA
jgi:hypothetical protein